MTDGRVIEGRDPTYRIRQARPDELHLLAEIDVAADRRFAATPYAAAVDTYAPVQVDDLAAMQDAWRLWVATDGDGAPVAFAHTHTDSDSVLHLAQVSVHPDHAGHRLTDGFLKALIRYHQGRGIAEITLTTFRDVPWNAPYYARIGFVEIPDAEADADPHLGPRLVDQVAHGLPRDSRVAMRLVLGR
ncbi:GNAT family N-acetyltransferase [Thalassobaculum salexigens]|uniref:GNAT family N-acetyltransferase n=1 Tax=Thalassobaculum salexigens TaxID=455360 RepID=UPI00248F2F4F|nr:GNAT family N-acetyltransferase [Thalassobaculum salexigens]